MPKRNTIIQVDEELHERVKVYATGKGVSFSRLVNELLLGLISRESAIVEEMRADIEKRLERGARSTASVDERIRLLEAQEKIRKEREAERRAKEERAAQREEEAHRRKVELERIKIEAKKEIEAMKIQARTKPQDAAPPISLEKEPDCIKCGEPQSSCVCLEE